MPPRRKAARTPPRATSKQQKMVLGEKILEELAASTSEETVKETVEGNPVPLPPPEPEEDKQNAALNRLMNRWSEEEMVGATLEPETIDDDKYTYNNSASVVHPTDPVLRDGESPLQAIARLAETDPTRQWHNRSEILANFNLDPDFNEIQMASSLSEVGLGLEAVGADKYRVKIWEN